MISNFNLSRRGVLLAAGAMAASRITRVSAQSAADRLIILGTQGGPIVLTRRKMAGQAIVVAGRIYLVDVGYGVVGRMVEAGLDLNRVEAVLISHTHSDHIADYPMLAYDASRNREDARGPIKVFGPVGMNQINSGALAVFGPDVMGRRVGRGGPGPFDRKFDVKELSSGGVLFDDGVVKVSAAVVNHPPFPSFAYRIDSATRSVVISGDTTPSDALVSLAKDADILVHEALSLAALANSRLDMPEVQRQGMISVHTTSEQAGEIATRAGVKTLVLSHLIPGEADIPDDTWKNEAARTFKGLIVVASDLMVL